MKIFSGFPAGKLSVTPLPNLFFTELLPTIDDLAELKLTLHLFWLFALPTRPGPTGQPQRGRAPYATFRELRADATLIDSLGITGEPPDGALDRALALALERGTLLCLRMPAAEGEAEEELYFLNTESGRRALEQMENGDLKFERVEVSPEPAGVLSRPNIFILYENNIGLLTPMITEELKDAEAAYPPEWIERAFKAAVENNKRSWSYIRAILERWKTEGLDTDKKGKPWYRDEYGKYVKR